MLARVLFTSCCLSVALIGCPFEGPLEPPDVLDDGAVSPPRFTARTATRTPPPLSGGTLLVLPDDRTAVASDPDHDVVWVADTVGGAEGRAVALRAGDEPGRLATDGAGRVFVALRRGGAVATIDPVRGEVTARRAVCPAPRGLTWDDATGRLLVACEDGALVSLGAEGAEVSRRQLMPDLRDIAVVNGLVYVTTFREARRYRVDASSVTPVHDLVPSGALRSAAWRTYGSDGALVTLSQRVQAVTLGTSNTPTQRGNGGGYGAIGGPTPPAVAPTVAITMMEGGEPREVEFTMGGLAVDVAVRSADDRVRVALVSPGWAYGQGVPQVQEWDISRTGRSVIGRGENSRVVDVPGQAVAATYTRSGWLVVQTRAPGAIVVGGRAITLYRDAVGDTGHDVFHATTPSGLACATCHPEGGDDGRVWSFEGIGRRRTPSLRGGILGTAPFHWDGDMRDIGHLTTAVFSARMGAGPIAATHATALGRWVQTVPTIPRPAAPNDAVARGEALFRSAEVGCASCHSGTMFTNNATVDVGTGGAFQVPPLVGLAARGPFMHSGCAPTLEDRFTSASCGGGDRHGHTSQLTPAQRGDLVAYLASL